MENICKYRVVDSIAIIEMCHPPVNALSLALRKSISEGFKAAQGDQAVNGVILASNCELFSGGADILEFGSGGDTKSPFLPQICNIIDDFPKLVVAAIQGSAFGGGFELALSCDYRFAAPKVLLGLPEVNLGIIPGAGGTQRLPRLLGAEKSVKMMVSGKPEKAEILFKDGVVDHIFDGEGDFLQAAVSYTKGLLAEKVTLRDYSKMKVDTSDLNADFFSGFRKEIARKTRGFFAPERVIRAVEAAVSLPFVEGLNRERDLFLECAATSQARGQLHVFFAERAATKIPDIDESVQVREIRSVCIIGAGTMGTGIAIAVLAAGYSVILLDLSQEALESGMNSIRKNFAREVEKGRMTDATVEKILSQLKGTVDYGDIVSVDLVIEAVFEKMEIKKAVFEQLDVVCKPGAILATNTSTLDVNEIAAVTNRAEDVIGMHFFSPANIMRLLEIIRAEQTGKDVIATSLKFAKSIRKVSVVAGVCHGFIGNRMVAAYCGEAERLLLEGASPAQVDKAIFDFGFAMGPFSMNDMAGNDVPHLSRQSYPQGSYDRDPSAFAVQDKLVSLGRLGQKTGRGFYLYEGRSKIVDPEIEIIAKELAERFGVTQRAISDEEIVQRCIFSLINEGALLLEEGIAYRSSDIDVVYCNGYGFPTYRGGPMHYADEIGLDKVVDALKGFQTTLGAYGAEFFKPAPLLLKLASAEQSLQDCHRMWGTNFKVYSKGINT